MQSRVAVSFGYFREAFVSRQFLAVLIVLSTFAVVPWAFAADDYLSELDDEAESSASVPNEDDPGFVRNGAGSNPAQNARAAFERTLRGERPSIYIFYGRLSDSDKARVVEFYAKNTENMSKTVNLVLDLYLKKK